MNLNTQFFLLVIKMPTFLHCRLISQLEGRVKTVGEEISSLEGVDRRVEELADKMARLARQLAAVRVWHQDHAETETKLAVSYNTIFKIKISQKTKM